MGRSVEPGAGLGGWAELYTQTGVVFVPDAGIEWTQPDDVNGALDVEEAQRHAGVPVVREHR